MIQQLLSSPETSSLQFLSIGRYDSLIYRAMDVHQFALALAFKDITTQKFRYEFLYSQFFSHLSLQGVRNIFTVVNMSSGGCIPFTGLYILPSRSFLQIESALLIENMQMNDRMQGLGTAMRLASCHLSDYLSLFVYHRE